MNTMCNKSTVRSGSGGGDLMGDLMASLNRRRKGISGNSQNTGGEKVGAMDRISAMIPPPKPRGDTTTSTTDDDWD